ncbi:MAG: efflux RND transporter periplasmic adaptor subunit [Candidatus Paceibacterota bacterium]
MNQTKLDTIKKFLFRKRILIPLGIIILVTAFSLARGNGSSFTVITPRQGVLSETVRATGQVTSSTDLNLSFGSQGEVRQVLVSVGDKVLKDAILATLDSRSLLASVTQARATLLSAEAKVKQTGEGVLRANVALVNARRDLEATKITHDSLVSSAYHELLNSTPEAFSTDTSDDISVPVISGTYKLGKEGTITLSGYYSSGGSSFRVSGLTTGSGMATTNNPQPLGDSGLYVTFPNTSLIVSDWVISIPNKKASDYLTNLNAYNNAVKARAQAVSKAQSVVDEKVADLSIKRDPTFSADTDLARAEVLGAQGGLESAISKYEDTILRAPANGTITKIDVKYGETTDTNTPAMVLQDLENLYVEALINESNITSIALDQTVAITIDALGVDKVFAGKVVHVDPASLTTDGVVNYKIKVSLIDKNPLIRPGMNAEITITAYSKENVLSIPRASVSTRDGKSYVNVITNEKRHTFEEREIKTGVMGDGNQIEVVSGLTANDRITLTVKK